MTPESTILRYLKVMALATRGAPGERDNAARRAAKMEEAHPTLRRDAKAYIRRQKAAQSGQSSASTQSRTRASTTPSGVWPKGATARNSSSTNGPFVGNWENIFDWVQQAAGGFQQAGEAVNQFVGTVADAQYGRHLGSMARGYTKETRAGNLIMGVRLPVKTAAETRHLNELQREAFRQALREQFEAELDSVFGET